MAKIKSDPARTIPSIASELETAEAKTAQRQSAVRDAEARLTTLRQSKADVAGPAADGEPGPVKRLAELRGQIRDAEDAIEDGKNAIAHAERAAAMLRTELA